MPRSSLERATIPPSVLVGTTTTTTSEGEKGGLDHDFETLDLAVGSPYREGTATDSGAVYLLHLNAISGNVHRSFVLASIDPYGWFVVLPARI